MTEDAGLKLLAAIEALQAEVRLMREEAREGRDSRENLQALKDRKAVSQKKWRKKSQKRVSGESTEESREILHAVVVKDLKQRDQDQVLTTARVESTKNLPPPTRPSREAYAEAYRKRYGVEPVWNAKVNAQIVQLVKRLGAEEAPVVAAFYLRHNHAKYVGNRHPVGLLLQDCEGLRTQWATGKTTTAAANRQEDQTQANLDGWAELMSEEGRRALVSK